MEQRFIAKVQKTGDQSAFSALVQMHQSAVRGFLRRLLAGDVALADDLAQETFIKAFLHIKTYKGSGKFLSWLFQIAYREFAGYRRRHKYDNLVSSYPNLDNEQVASAAGCGEKIVDKQVLDNLLLLLDEETRSALTLNYQQGMSHSEVAEIMSLPLGTVKTRIKQGKAMLLEKLQPAFSAPPAHQEAI